MMSPVASPAPSDVPVNKDNANGGDQQEDLGLNVIVNTEGSESDESDDENGDEAFDQNVYNGYVALEQQPPDEGNYADGESNLLHQQQLNIFCESQADDCVTSNNSVTLQNEAMLSNHSNQVHQKPVPANNSEFQITDSHAEVIKEAMAGFSLPSNNIPEWARVVPEENWKSKLMDSIAKKQ